jgi:hypothetical protein
MPWLNNQLELDRCPHCSVDKPSMIHQWEVSTDAHSGGNSRYWRIYKCSRCGGLVTAAAPQKNDAVTEMYPSAKEVNETIPKTAKDYLIQALNSLHSPAGAVMLAASAIDALLKEKGYKNGKLYPRINKAAKEHVITSDMAKWAHQVRLDANDQRHADEEAIIPTGKDAQRSVDFALALAEVLFVLPSKVTRGLEEAKETEESTTETPENQ